MKKMYLLFLSGLFLFIIIIPSIDYRISHQKYISKFGMFNINSNETEARRLNDSNFEIYEIVFKSKIDYKKFIESVNKTENTLKYDSTAIEKNQNINNLLMELKRKKSIRNEVDEVYCIYKTIDHEVYADIIFTDLASDSCYFMMDFKCND
ncbi:hypothetical protein [Aedoeadaptatus acetigenes]|uniref:hypothetical protein n=1 Tax=Aedoeadaptatus acetigenes TaxID=2981723 RepID=UPI0011DE4CE3|nr:hypothetical protein [Aedoeadaptatus acetigenes]MCU6786764.1 hypothetical protein [Aedoeadaptatus acetigenes]